ncbi:MAG: FecCD family ABC transporter permease [Egibacteraceae bacterium]
MPAIRPWTEVEDSIVWTIRAPRILLAALVGAGLAVVGVVMQALVRNPLADPYLLGISSGAGLGAVLVIVGGISLGIVSVSAGAFVGALLTFLLVYAMARQGGTMAPCA